MFEVKEINKYWIHYLRLGLFIVVLTAILLLCISPTSIGSIDKAIFILLEISILLAVLLYSKVMTNSQIEKIMRKYQIGRQQIYDEYRNALSYSKISIGNSFIFIRKNMIVYIIPRQDVTRRERLKIKQNKDTCSAMSKSYTACWYCIESNRIKVKVRVRNNGVLLDISNAFEEKGFRKLQPRTKNVDCKLE